MKYLLDTCCISDFIKNDKNTVFRLQNTPPNEIAVSTISVMELEYGLLLNPARGKKIRPYIEDIISSVHILPYGLETANYSAAIRAALKKTGKPIGSYDVLIAGIALEHGLILVTANTKEFQRIPKLHIENWRD